MFDLNMCDLALNHRFFAKVIYCNIGCELYNFGLRDGDVVQCKMLSEESDNPNIMIKLGAGEIEAYSYTQFSESSLVFEGNLDGTGFICEQSKEKAMRSLNNKDGINE